MGACSSSFRCVPAPCTHIQGSTGWRRSGYNRGSLRCAQHGRSHSGGKRRIWLFPSLGFFGDVIRRCPAEPRLSGTGLCGSRHRRPWLHTRHPSRRITRNTDAGNRFERHGNRAGVAAGGRTPPCLVRSPDERGASDGSQRLSAALDSRRRRFRRGNPLTEMARTTSDLHIFAILLRLARPRRACERSESARQR